MPSSASRSKKSGLPPGTPVHVGRRRTQDVRITLTAFDGERLVEQDLAQLRDSLPFVDRYAVVWVNVSGLHDVSVVEQAGECFGLHALSIEDVVATGQRPKAEVFDDYLFVVLQAIHRGNSGRALEAEQVSLVVGSGYVLSFQESDRNLFGAVRDRLKRGSNRVRTSGAGYLAYTLMDVIVDHYFDCLEHLSDLSDGLHDTVLTSPTQEHLHSIHRLKHALAGLRRAVWPLLDVAGALARLTSDRSDVLLPESLRPYVSDLRDHALRVAETTDALRDAVNGLTDLYLAGVGYRTNEVMRVLTIYAMIFIPLTFIAGVYGMNFDFMPELHWRWAYPAALLLMAAVAGAMLLSFRRKRWL